MPLLYNHACLHQGSPHPEGKPERFSRLSSIRRRHLAGRVPRAKRLGRSERSEIPVQETYTRCNVLTPTDADESCQRAREAEARQQAQGVPKACKKAGFAPTGAVCRSCTTMPVSTGASPSRRGNRNGFPGSKYPAPAPCRSGSKGEAPWSPKAKSPNNAAARHKKSPEVETIGDFLF